MVLSLQEIAFSNLRVIDILHPNIALDEYPRDCHILPETIFRIGKRQIINELCERDEFIRENWPLMNNHQCLINDGPLNRCWCGCDPNENHCICICMLPVHILIDLIEEEMGDINREASFRIVTARINFL